MAGDSNLKNQEEEKDLATKIDLGNQALHYLHELLDQTAFYELPNQVNANSAPDRPLNIRNRSWLVDMRGILAYSKDIGAELMYQALDLSGDNTAPISDMTSLRLNVANELVALLDCWSWMEITSLKLQQFEGSMAASITSIDSIIALSAPDKQKKAPKLDSSKIETLNQLRESLELDRTELGEILQEVQQEMTKIFSTCYSVLHGWLPKPTVTTNFTALHRVINDCATDEDWKTARRLIDQRRLLVERTNWESWSSFEYSSEARAKRETLDKVYQEAETKYHYLWSTAELLGFQDHELTWNREGIV